MNNKINVRTQQVRFQTAPELYGLFFEDINHAADGGLYPEMIRNRAFEDSLVPEGCETDENHVVYWNDGRWPGAFNHGEGMDEWCAAVPPTEIPGWYAENAVMTLDEENTLNKSRKAALKVDFSENGRIHNIGYFGVPVKINESYNFYCFLKCKQNAEFIIRLEGASGENYGEAEISVKASEGYERYDVSLLASGTDYNGRIVILSKTAASVSLGFTSLLPAKTFKNHGLREDLAMALKDTHSTFIRFPGGCVVEGINNENALRFSKSIGPVWERPSAQLMWHYRTTNGLGFHEYLQLCEDLEMEALYVCNCGMSCQARHGKGFCEDIVKEYLDEALHALEYALGSENTTYGAIRAQQGHKEPFKLKYVEIGNENFGPEYLERYELFYKTLKEAYPDVIYISNNHTEENGLATEIVDEHYYNAPEFFLENGDMFDDYPRQGPDIFLGEYAVNGGNTIASMECALAEGVFLAGVERNQDIVKLTAYAPLFQNSDYTAWKPNLIVFNNHEVYGIPSYHVISLMAKYRGKEVIAVENQSEMRPPIYSGIPGIMCEKEGLEFKNVKMNGVPVDISRHIYGETEICREDEDDKVYRMIKGTHKHHYTGKSKEWNEAFEDFIHSGDFRERPMIWAAFGQDAEEYTFEIDAKFDADNPVTFSIWNHCPETDAGCNEPRDTEWTFRSVRNQAWKIENGMSLKRVPRIFEKPLGDEDKIPVHIDYTQFNHYKIVSDNYGFSCYINDELIQTKKHRLHPLVSAAASQDENKVILKLMNVGAAPLDTEISLDCEIMEEAVREMICAAPEEVNSFENKENVSAVCENITVSGNQFVYTMPAHSIHVLVLNKK